MGGELSISFAFGSSEAPKDSGNHFVVILEGIVVVPRWSVTSGFVVVVVVLLFGLKLLSQAKAILHLVLAVLVEGAQAFEDLLVLLVVVALGMGFINSDDDVVWSTAMILTSFGPFRPITTTVLMVAAIIVVAVTMVSFVEVLVSTVSWVVSARILVEADFGLFSVIVLIDGRNHLANPLWWLTIEFGAEVAVMKSSDKGGDDFCFRDVGNIIPHLKKSSDVAMEELERFLIDAIQIMLGARPSTRSHVIVGEDLLQLFPRFDGIWGEAHEPVN